MEIGPVRNSFVNQYDKRQKESPKADSENLKDNRDKIVISDDARAKIAELADEKRIGDKKVDEVNQKLEKIKNKIEAGFYDTKEVKEKIIGKLADDILDENDRFREID